VSAVEQASAQLASSEAALKRAGLDYDRQQALSTKGLPRARPSSNPKPAATRA